MTNPIEVESLVPAVAEKAPETPQADPSFIAVPTSVSEVIFWNQTDTSVSAGLAILNKDQLNIAIYKTAHLDRKLRPEMAPGLTQVKAGEAMKFNLCRAPESAKTPDITSEAAPAASNEVAPA